jgi:DNA-binding PadR family transcriptional regulator
MNKLDKLRIALNTIKEHNITAYEIGKNTKISTFAIQKIISGDTKNPNERTIDDILDFLEKATIATNYKENLVNEEKEDYKISPKTNLEKCLSEQVEMIRHISYLEALLTQNNILFKRYLN